MSRNNNGGPSSHGTAAQNKSIKLNFNIQLELPTLSTEYVENSKAPKKAMDYEYSESPAKPTGRQNKFVLSKLQECSFGLTTVELTAMGVADPRPRIRDLRELGWRIETIQPEPHDVGRYVLLAGGGDL